MNVFRAHWFTGPFTFTWLDIIVAGGEFLMDYIDEHPELAKQMNLPQRDDPCGG